MGMILISYDVNRNHTDVKEAMKHLGYLESGKYNDGKRYLLPNTTLWHKSKSTLGTINDLKIICKTLSVELEKTVAVQASDFEGVNPLLMS